MPWWKRTKDPGFEHDDDRSFAVALRLEMVAQRLAVINKELESKLEEQLDTRQDDRNKAAEGGGGP
jgi:hypothetical protein